MFVFLGIITVIVTVIAIQENSSIERAIKLLWSVAPTPTMASVRCRCGAVSLTFPTREPVNAFECCCVDCYDKLIWSCDKASVQPPQAFVEHGKHKPLDLRYWPNRLVVKGEEHLSFNRLREGATSTNMVTTCCHTLLCVDHPFYQKNVVMMFPEFVPLTGAGELIEPPLRVHIADWPADEYAKLPNKPGTFRQTNGQRGGSPEAADMMARVGAVFSKPPPAGPGATFQELLAGAGGIVTNLGLPEGSHSNSVRAFARRRQVAGAALAIAGAAASAVAAVAVSRTSR